ncbi:MAG: helix-turn-helix transcriptional regulator, partial [Erysipelotrichaceae bacterium]|nr:helix-turn-helix transcriptional regulator [Erysipelotrichaceae bacterium]
MYPMIDKEKTGMMIQDYMRMKDLTAKDIQEALGLTSVQAVYHWINGRCLPSLDNIYALSDLLKVP